MGLMSKCSRKCNEIKEKIDSISGLDDEWIYAHLLLMEKQVVSIVNAIEKYADDDELNGTVFKDWGHKQC